MQDSYLEFIPFPYIHENEKNDGLLLGWTDVCKKCTRNNCFDADIDKYGICSLGYNSIKVSKDLVIGGFILNEYLGTSSARTKRLRFDKSHIINKGRIEKLIDKISKFEKSIREDIDREKNKIVNSYVLDNSHKDDFLRDLNKRLTEAFSSLHDFKQFSAKVSQNINVVIETRYEGSSLDEKLEHAEHAEKAIYWLSKMMDNKLNVTKYLAHPDRIDSPGSITLFSLHGLVLKYLRIYEMDFRAKGIRPQVGGSSRGKILCNAEAVGVIIQTFIDNAYKYSPKRKKVELYFSEDEEQISFSVSSYGPLIKEDEKEKIFQPFQRALAAIKQEEDGTGFGLFISNVIAKRLGGEIVLFQNLSNHISNNFFWTTFKIHFERKG